MNLHDLVRQALEAGGYDGLFHADGDCACKKDDLFPCGEPSPSCQPGYERPCPGCCGEHDWHIAAAKPSDIGEPAK